MRFTCTIPTSNRAFGVPGTRADLRVSFDLPESEVPEGLKLILLRGRLFKLKVSEVEYVNDQEQISQVIETWSSIAPKSSAIRVDGRDDGMSITLSFPSINEKIFSKFLGLREKLLILDIDEDTYKEVK